MKNKITPDEKFKLMTSAPTEKLVLKLAGPTIVSMMITSIYNMADTYFVSQISTSASGSVGIAFPLMMLIQAIGFTISIGSGNYISRLLGQKNREHASKVLSTGFFTALILSAVLGVIGLIFLDPLVYALGATDTIAPHAKDYIRYILLGMPFMASSFVLNGTLRFQGSSFYSMLGIGAGGVINIILDPIFIFTLDMGTGGAALATIISQFISFCILIVTTNLGGNLKIKLKDFTPKWGLYKEILRGGLPSFYRQVLGSLAMIFLNFNAKIYGDAAIAAMSITGKIIHFAVSVMLGIGQGFQPVCGFNYGAKLYDRVLKAFWFAVKLSITALTVIGLVIFIASPQIITLFRKEDLDVIAIGSLALRLQCVTLPFSAWVIMMNMLLQTTGKSKEASIISISRQGLFFIPAVYILPRIFGLLGIQLSQPTADIFSFFLAIVVGKRILAELRTLQKASIG